MSQSVVQSALSGPQYDAWLGYHSELPRANEFTKRRLLHGANLYWRKRTME